MAGTAPRGAILRYLPRGGELPRAVWWNRHRGILWLLWLHVPAVFGVAMVKRVSVSHAVLESSLIVGLAMLATAGRRHQRLSTVIAAVGLLTCSAELVHLSEGLIEMHFHYFVMVGVVTLYQDWRPFLTAIGYVVLQHGLAGALAPESVYNHPAAVGDPWTWAGVHGLFVLGMSIAGVITWRLNENLLADARRRERELQSSEAELRASEAELRASEAELRESEAELRESEAELRVTLSLLSATLDSTADGILVVDGDGRISSFNRRFVDIWAVPEDVLVSRDDNAALQCVLDQLLEPATFLMKVQELYAQPEAESYDTLDFKDGRVVERYSKPQRVGGRVVGRVWSFRDVTERKRLEDELAHQAFHDSLTRLANKVLFRDRVEHALSRCARTGGHLAVIFLDLDNFKTVNDSLGHTAGDELLVGATERLRACIRSADTAARLGGDEFAVLIEDTVGNHEVLAVADRILASLRLPFELGGSEAFISASIGIVLDAPGLSADQLLRNADLAMYTAKGAGKDRYEVYAPAMHEAAVARLELTADLRRATERAELRLEYQPIVDLHTGELSGVEALLRWNHPVRGAIPPALFIQLAEESGLIDEIGRWVLHEACTQVRRWQLAHPRAVPLSVSVNLSPRQLRDEGFAAALEGVLTATGMAPETLTLEITEGAMMHDTEVALSRLQAFKRQGVRLAVDDFGTGYSSLSYLQRFPIDVLKIDRSFVQRLDQGAEDASLARAIVRLAHTLHLQAVAEGVETDEQLQMLRRIRCEYAQGYRLCRPVAPETIEAVLDGSHAFDVSAARVPALAS